MYQRAGPPMRYQVWGASGSFSFTISSSPSKGLVTRQAHGRGRAHEVSRSPRHQAWPDFPYVPRSHGHNQVAWAARPPQEISGDLVEVRADAGPAGRSDDPLDQIGGAHRGALGLAVAHKVDVRHDGLVGRREAGREIFQQKSGAAVLVWLKDTEEPLGLISPAEGRERRADFGGVMPVVVDDVRAVVVANVASSAGRRP